MRPFTTRWGIPGLFALLLLSSASMSRAADPAPWTSEQARAWGKKTPWLVGCNYIPSTAINQLEMWQADSFDPATIDRELALAEGLGFNSVRVFLHDQLWTQDAAGFLKRIDEFLAIADRHKIGVMFVLFDAVWDPRPRLGKQPAPRPHVHNSGWAQSPGAEVLKDPARQDALEPYVKGVVGHLKDDPRVQVWDLFNEPDNPNRNSYGNLEPEGKPELARRLLEKTFRWAREAGATQPLTSGVWIGNDWSNPDKLSPMERLQLDQSDVISFHSYEPEPGLTRAIESLARYQRPVLCTEFMARGNNSRFDPNLAALRERRVGAYCWGFVAGKSQTIYPWDSWQKTYTAEPRLWFHDIFRADGTPYDPAEVDYIRKVTGKAATPAP